MKLLILSCNSLLHVNSHDLFHVHDSNRSDHCRFRRLSVIISKPGPVEILFLRTRSGCFPM